MSSFARRLRIASWESSHKAALRPQGSRRPPHSASSASDSSTLAAGDGDATSYFGNEKRVGTCPFRQLSPRRREPFRKCLHVDNLHVPDLAKVEEHLVGCDEAIRPCRQRRLHDGVV